MQLREVGEFGLIRRIERMAGVPSGRDVVLGIGDDAALLRLRRGELLAVTTDAFVHGVHFRFDQESPATAGRRALAATLSDLAAMGARPLGVTLALAAPGSQRVAPLLALVRGLLAGAARHAAPLLGGNVSAARELSITLTALGAVGRSAGLRRAGARPGDRVFVTGALGRSALERARGRVRHVPEPRLAAGRRLARLSAAGACIDLSDGLLADLGHVAEASRVRVVVEPARVPQAPGLAAAARRLGIDPHALCLAGGEDYELAFSVRRGGPGAAALARRLGVPVAEIGRVEAGSGVALEPPPRGLRASGWRHFGPPRMR